MHFENRWGFAPFPLLYEGRLSLCSFGLSLRSGPRPADLGATDYTCVSSLLTWGQDSPEAKDEDASVGHVGLAIGNPAVAGVGVPTAAT